MLSQIENIICLEEGVLPSDIHKKSRKTTITEVRQIIMYFAKELDKNMSWAKISRYFDLDHATALHAHKTIQNRIDTNREFSTRMCKHRLNINSISMVVYASDILKPLNMELEKTEKKVVYLKEMIAKISKDLDDLNKTIEKPIYVKDAPTAVTNVIPMMKVVKMPFEMPNNRHINETPTCGAYNGYVKHY